MSSVKIGTLTEERAHGLRRIRDRGPGAWCDGTRRNVARKMFVAMAAEGLCTAEPYTITEAGEQALVAYEAELATRRERHQPLSMLGRARYG